MPEAMTAPTPPATPTPPTAGHVIVDGVYYGPLTPPPPAVLDTTAQPDTERAPMQAHRTTIENGEEHYSQEEDPKPNPAGEFAADPAFSPFNGHRADRDSNGNINYFTESGVRNELDEVSATADPASAPHAHYLVGDGSGEPEYISFTGDANGPDKAPTPTGNVTNGADTAAPACDTRHTFGGQDEPVEYGCPTGAFEPDPAGGSVLPAGLRIVAATANPPQPVILPATSNEQNHAALFTASVWQAITQAGGPRPSTPAHTHVRGLFDPAWLARLTTPTREVIPEGLSVTLGGGGFERYPDHAAMLAAYMHRPRTWIFERTHHAIPWISLAAAYLGRLSASPLEVLATVFDSRPHEHAPGPHTDQWYSVIVQFDGAKHWTIGTGPEHQQLTTEPGDLLLIPEGLAHATTTPLTPGYSRHLTIGLCRHTQYARAA